MIKSYGQMAKKINQRMEELKAADDLFIMKHFPAARCHELVGNRKGQLAVDISGNYRMIFEPVDDPPPMNEDGSLDWKEVISIRVIEIEDYHSK